jgi:hypothetical protein
VSGLAWALQSVDLRYRTFFMCSKLVRRRISLFWSETAMARALFVD